MNDIVAYSTELKALMLQQEKIMNPTLDLLMNRRTHRSFSDRPIEHIHHELIQQATLRAPTAGNMMFYSVIEVTDKKGRPGKRSVNAGDCLPDVCPGTVKSRKTEDLD